MARAYVGLLIVRAPYLRERVPVRTRDNWPPAVPGTFGPKVHDGHIYAILGNKLCALALAHVPARLLKQVAGVPSHG
ncbi:hypothetical protein [Streptomyces sp. NPDC002403]